MLVLPGGPNSVGVALSLLENGNRSNFRNVVFSRYLEFRKMDEIYKPINFEYHTPSSEPLKFYKMNTLAKYKQWRLKLR
jgi:hypothetical protein